MSERPERKHDPTSPLAGTTSHFPCYMFHLQVKMYQEALQKLEAQGEVPDGEVMLTVSKEEMVKSWGFSLSLSVKLDNRLRAIKVGRGWGAQVQEAST